MNRTCFISAPAGTDLAPLRHALSERHVLWTDHPQMPMGGPLFASIRDAIRDADFFCLVIPKSVDARVSFFELGLAHAFEKPILAFVESDRDVPSFLRHFQYAKSSIDDSESLRLHLGAFLRFFDRSKRTGPPQRTPHPPRHGLIDQARVAVNQGEWSRFEESVREILESSGYSVSPPTDRKHQADLALWIDSLHDLLGNPLLVEIKGGQLSEARLRDAEEQLRHHVFATGGQVGLLIYLDKEDRDFPQERFDWPLVLRLTVPELYDALSNGTFEWLLAQARNRAAHGGS